MLICLSLSAAPRLTVVAVVDGMTTENLTMLRPFWQQGGLRTLSEEAFQTSIAYPHLVYGGNETTATLMTGVTPDRHGYTMDIYFQRQDRKQHAMLEDETAHGIGTSLRLSPRHLLSQTISDRMRLRYPDAKIYAVGIQPGKENDDRDTGGGDGRYIPAFLFLCRRTSFCCLRAEPKRTNSGIDGA